MCGIFGFTKVNNRTRQLAPFLAMAMEDRGKESWGYSYISKKTKRVKLYKEIGPLGTAYADNGFPPKDASSIIYHTRAASMGAITAANAHPFIKPTVGGGVIVGTHNGVVTNHTELNTDNETKFRVDSEQIWHYVGNGLDTGEIGGWGSTVAFVQDPKNLDDTFMLFLRFNHDALHIAKLPYGDGFAYASTKGPLEDAIRIVYGSIHKEAKLFTIDTECLYFIPVLDNKKSNFLWRGWKQEFGTRGNWQGRHISDLPESARPTGGSSHFNGWNATSHNRGRRPATTVNTRNQQQKTHEAHVELAEEDRTSTYATCVSCNRAYSVARSTEVICATCLTFFVRSWDAVQDNITKEVVH